ncbi:MAG TPA: PadR family transcriptional regulator [Steroidobacteraceae bacterium]|nr:PadR family transcriptional regulator [Steroidobacteraceae bacterium]
MTDLIVLALLLDGPRYGYRLKREAGLAQGRRPLHSNVIYPLLGRFAESGWVAKTASPGKRGQTRLLYTLTPAGRAELLRRLATFPPKEAESDSAFQLRIGLFHVLSPGVRAQVLDTREAFLRAREQRLVEITKHFQAAPFPADVLRFRLLQTRAERAWIRRLRRMAALAPEPGSGAGRNAT